MSPPEATSEFTGRQAKEHYRRFFAGAESFNESVGEAGEPDFSAPAITDRVERAEAELKRIVKTHLGDQPHLYELAERIAREGGGALEAIANDDDEKLAKPEVQAALEVIARTDGSRPSFLVKNNRVDFASSPVGDWRDVIVPAADEIEQAVSCVGRIDHPKATQGFRGTGFLIAPDLILTNRHVLQAIAVPDGDGWNIDAGVKIDFGHEFRARESVKARALRSVVFCGKDPILQAIDHSKLDLALIELEPAGAANRPPYCLAFDVSPDWAQPDLIIFTIGYPANPGLTEQLTLVEQLFESTFGFKRLAPGTITNPVISSPPKWLAAHDCTTLGGNSGSVVVAATRGTVACGLHYGGRRALPRENWGHILGLTLDAPNGLPRNDGEELPTLRKLLKDRGVKLIDRQPSNQ